MGKGTQYLVHREAEEIEVAVNAAGQLHGFRRKAWLVSTLDERG